MVVVFVMKGCLLLFEMQRATRHDATYDVTRDTTQHDKAHGEHKILCDGPCR